jgi:ammonia channel protein AmtB
MAKIGHQKWLRFTSLFAITFLALLVVPTLLKMAAFWIYVRNNPDFAGGTLVHINLLWAFGAALIALIAAKIMTPTDRASK